MEYSYDLDRLLEQLRMARITLAYTTEGAGPAWRSAQLTPELRRAIHNRRRGLARLMTAGDIRLCPARDLHRAYWYHAGQGRYLCEICQRLAS